MSQYQLYMQDPFWRKMSTIGFNERTAINSRFYNLEEKDARYTPGFIWASPQYSIQSTRASEGPGAYLASIPDVNMFPNGARRLGEFRTCVRETRNPRACAKAMVANRCCDQF